VSRHPEGLEPLGCPGDRGSVCRVTWTPLMTRHGPPTSRENRPAAAANRSIVLPWKPAINLRLRALLGVSLSVTKEGGKAVWGGDYTSVWCHSGSLGLSLTFAARYAFFFSSWLHTRASGVVWRVIFWATGTHLFSDAVTSRRREGG